MCDLSLTAAFHPADDLEKLLKMIERKNKVLEHVGVPYAFELQPEDDENVRGSLHKYFTLYLLEIDKHSLSEITSIEILMDQIGGICTRDDKEMDAIESWMTQSANTAINPAQGMLRAAPHVSRG